MTLGTAAGGRGPSAQTVAGGITGTTSPACLRVPTSPACTRELGDFV
jgi:hypothetical protein